ncbi:hypothetical protein ACFQ69_36945, partial [Streptomyces sp. NPDC056470]
MLFTNAQEDFGVVEYESDGGISRSPLTGIPIPRRPPLVGREAILDELRKELAGTQHSGALFAGGSGSGKTRLLQECGVLARQFAMRTLTVQPSPALQRLPLQALAGAMASAGMPLPDTFANATAALAREHRRRPLLVCVDDAHLLDTLSAAVLAQLARENSCRLAVAVTDGQPAPEQVVGYWKERWLRRLPVNSLHEPQLITVCQGLLPEPMEFTTAARFALMSQGNLVMLRELVSDALEHGTLVRSNGFWTDIGDDHGARLNALVAPRVSGLTPAARTALETLGHAETLPLRAALSLADTHVWEELEGRGLAHTAGNGNSPTITLKDKLAGHIVITGMSPLRRRRLLGRLLDALSGEGNFGVQREVQLTLWRHRAGDAVDETELLKSAKLAWWMRDWKSARTLSTAAWQTHHSAAAGLLLIKVLTHEGRRQDAERLLQELTAKGDDRITALAAEIVSRALLTRPSAPARVGSSQAVAPPPAATTSQTVPQPRKPGQSLDHAVHLLLSGRCAEAWTAVEETLQDTDPRRVAVAGAVALPALIRMGRPMDALELVPRMDWA